MTAARVLNPIVLTEFCKIRASPTAAAAAVAMGRISGGGTTHQQQQQLKRIKRDLFGPVNPVETNKMFIDELDKHQELAIKKWSFDFRTGKPIHMQHAQYVWERVTFAEAAHTPEMYTLTRVAHLRSSEATKTSSMREINASAYDLLLDERAERENFTTTTCNSSLLSTSNGSLSATDTEDSCDDSQDEIHSSGNHCETFFKVPATSNDGSSSVGNRILNLRKRQPKITEYMKERKRLTQTPKKFSSPAKRMRISSPGSNDAHVQEKQNHQYSISTLAKFSIRKLQR